jgi:hypothetical protein
MDVHKISFQSGDIVAAIVLATGTMDLAVGFPKIFPAGHFDITLLWRDNLQHLHAIGFYAEKFCGRKFGQKSEPIQGNCPSLAPKNF